MESGTLALRQAARLLTCPLAPIDTINKEEQLRQQSVCFFVPAESSMILRFLQGSPSIASASPALSLGGTANGERLKSNMDDMFKNAALSKEEEELFNQLQEREVGMDESPRVNEEEDQQKQKQDTDIDDSYKEFVDGLSNGASGSSSSQLKDKHDESSSSDTRTPDRPTRLSDVHLEERNDLSVTFSFAPIDQPAQEVQLYFMGVAAA